jgi:hypothetical protein
LGEWKAFSDTALYGQAISLAIQPVQCIPLAIEKSAFDQQQLHIYPNPVIQAELTIRHALKNGVWQIYSMDGKLIQSGALPFGNTLNIDSGELPLGMYLIKIEDGQLIQTGKFLKSGN